MRNDNGMKDISILITAEILFQDINFNPNVLLTPITTILFVVHRRRALGNVEYPVSTPGILYETKGSQPTRQADIQTTECNIPMLTLIVKPS